MIESQNYDTYKNYLSSMVNESNAIDEVEENYKHDKWA